MHEAIERELGFATSEIVSSSAADFDAGWVTASEALAFAGSDEAALTNLARQISGHTAVLRTSAKRIVVQTGTDELAGGAEALLPLGMWTRGDLTISWLTGTFARSFSIPTCFDETPFTSNFPVRLFGAGLRFCLEDLKYLIPDNRRPKTKNSSAPEISNGRKHKDWYRLIAAIIRACDEGKLTVAKAIATGSGQRLIRDLNASQADLKSLCEDAYNAAERRRVSRAAGKTPDPADNLTIPTEDEIARQLTKVISELKAQPSSEIRGSPRAALLPCSRGSRDAEG